MNSKGVIIYKRWLLVDKELYLVKSNEVLENKFTLALKIIDTGSDDVNMHAFINNIPVGVVRRAKNIYLNRRGMSNEHF